MSGFVVWLTGLSGTGKSTLASLLTTELIARGVQVECLDGDEVRKVLSHGLGFAREDRDRNVRRIGFVARMVARSGACAITAAISPYRALRDEIRSKTENFIEVYCECPIEVLTTRDPKGLYKRALAGEIKNFTGVDDPYEAPENPEVHLRTDLSSPEECLAQIISVLDERGLLENDPKQSAKLPPAFGGEVFESRKLTSAEAERDLPRVDVPPDLAEEIKFVAAGFLSPVSGFMSERESHKVANSGALERGTPWWTSPFVLPVKDARDIEPGDSVLLISGGEVFAEATCQELWEEDGQTFMGGPLDAIVTASVSARAIRKELGAQGHTTASCLFLANPPDERTAGQVELAFSLVPGLVLSIAQELEAAWEPHLSALGSSGPRFVVPARVPIKSERARTVMARAVGASRQSLI